MSFWKKLVQKFVPGTTADSATPTEVEAEIDWEALLLEADLGLTLTQKWTAALTTQKLLKKPLAAEQFLRAEMLKLLEPPAYRLILDKPEVIMLVGVIYPTAIIIIIRHERHIAFKIQRFKRNILSNGFVQFWARPKIASS